MLAADLTHLTYSEDRGAGVPNINDIAATEEAAAALAHQSRPSAYDDAYRLAKRPATRAQLEMAQAVHHPGTATKLHDRRVRLSPEETRMLPFANKSAKGGGWHGARGGLLPYQVESLSFTAPRALAAESAARLRDSLDEGSRAALSRVTGNKGSCNRSEKGTLGVTLGANRGAGEEEVVFDAILPIAVAARTNLSTTSVGGGSLPTAVERQTEKQKRLISLVRETIASINRGELELQRHLKTPAEYALTGVETVEPCLKAGMEQIATLSFDPSGAVSLSPVILRELEASRDALNPRRLLKANMLREKHGLIRDRWALHTEKQEAAAKEAKRKSEKK